MPDGPLSGIRVLEFSVILSGPYAGCQLSDLGAEVVKVEPPGGDPYRGTAGIVPGYSKLFQSVNRGKRSIIVNLKQPEGRETIYRLLPAFDIVLINYRFGVPARLGIDYETLSALRPDLIYIDISGFGAAGPLAHRAASDMVSQAYGGSTAQDGRLDVDGAPVWMSIPIGDIPTGMAAALGGVMALYHRDRTGRGQLVQASLLRSVMSQLGLHLMREGRSDAHHRDRLKAEMARVRERGGSYDEIVAARFRFSDPARLYERGYNAHDGGIVLGATTRSHRDALRRAMELEDELTDVRPFDPLSDDDQRLITAIEQRISDTLQRRTVDEWLAVFAANGAPASCVNFAEELSDDQQGSLEMVELESDVIGTTRHAAPTIHLRNAPTAVQSAPPALGEGTDDVLRQLGAYSEDEIAELRARGAIA